MDFFFSKSTDNPSQVLDYIADPNNKCEKYYKNIKPPGCLTLSSNFQNISGIPFQDNNAYLVIFCKENEMIDNLQVNIIVTASQKKI